MGRDYGQRRAGGRQARSRGELPAWVWLIVGLAFGLAIAALMYITRPVERPDAPAQAPAPGKQDGARRSIPVPPKQPARFSFYEILPSYEVVIPRDRREGSKPAPIAEPGSYVIQVGSFRIRADAEQQKAKLALLGIESRVEQVTIDNNQTWFRVRIGPEQDLARVHMIMTQLNENRIESFLLRVKG